MKTSLQLLILCFILTVIFSACSKNDTSPYTYSSQATIFSEDEEVTFRELVFMIRPFVISEGEIKYVVTDSIFNVEVSINDEPWGNFESLGLNTSVFDTEVLGDLLVTDALVKYPVIAPFQSKKDTFNLAGEYADLLNNYLVLEPGAYICEIESFEMLLQNGDIKHVETYIVEHIQIGEDVVSVFLGEFDVPLNN